MTLDAQIEGILFFKGEPISIKKLALQLEKSEEAVKESLSLLEQKLGDRGLALMYIEGEVMLGTHPSLSGLIETIKKDDLVRELSKATLETLSIILYKSGVSRSEIDFIRGVNSSFILRNLLIRGLIEKKVDSEDSRRYLYVPTFDTLAYLGVSKVEDLPNYEMTKKTLENEMVEEDSLEPEIPVKEQ